MKWWWKIGTVLLSAVVLYISFARAGLERIKENNNFDKLRNVPISFQSKNDLGELKNYCYNIPETRTLPDSPWYLIKGLRDEFWIKLTKNPIEKAEIILLIADKKLEESIKLVKKGKENLANKTVKKAILKLEESKRILYSLDQQDVEVIKMNNKIIEATRAYKYLIDYLELDKETNNLFREKCYGQ